MLGTRDATIASSVKLKFLGKYPKPTPLFVTLHVTDLADVAGVLQTIIVVWIKRPGTAASPK
jgi:hypothetical protein